ncbi:MAG: DUF3105 domain-containing protein [Acidimicrobiales bacterium]
MSLPSSWFACPSSARVVAVVLVLALSSCSEKGEDQACGAIKRERLDPSSSVHLLPNAVEPTYLSDPPTSGPHLSGAPPQGEVDEPINRPSQVAILEQGGVLIQYRLPADKSLLAVLANGTSVVVAPNPKLSASVVATAWSVKQTCTKVDESGLRRFIKDRPIVGLSHE